jgi:hypothetical protein
MLVIVLLDSAASGQGSQRSKSVEGARQPAVTEQSITELHPTRSNPRRPEVTLPRALKIAEEYVKKQRINTSSYFLAEVKLIPAGRGVGEPYWWLMWVGISKPLGDYIEISVSMRGKAYRVPSM